MSDFTSFFVCVILLPATIIGGTVWGFGAMASRSCDIYAEETGTETKYRHFAECYLKTPSGWMPWSEYKARAVTQEKTK